jgi:hypothetical protein
MFRHFLALALTLAVFAQSTPAAAQSSAKDAPEPAIASFLKSYVSTSLLPHDDASYAYSIVRLSGRKAKEVIVYLTGRNWCGSGGCTALILVPNGSSYTVVTRTTVTQLPIRVLNSRTKGWHDVAVWVEGGGIEPGYEARLRFNGNKYPSNPTVAPALHLRSRVAGKIVIPRSAEGISLFP